MQQQITESVALRNAPRRAPAVNAIDLLTAEHRQLEKWFEQFGRSRSVFKKGRLVRRICNALRIHLAMEEEVFLPAFRDATGESALSQEANFEREATRKVLRQIEESEASEPYYHAKVLMLGEMVRHQIRGEEHRNGIFAEAYRFEMDLDALGERLQRRREILAADQRAARRSRRMLEMPTFA